MRTAYSGRAAAFEQKGEYGRAVADHNMVVLYYALEAEILSSLEAPDRDKVLAEAAAAYRARSRCLEKLGRGAAAQADLRRAATLQADANQLVSKSARASQVSPREIGLSNAWNEPVSLVVAGVSYRLGVGEQRTIPAVSAEVAYEMQAGPYRRTGRLEAGRTYIIRPPSP
jgi:hypothetical protein